VRQEEHAEHGEKEVKDFGDEITEKTKETGEAKENLAMKVNDGGNGAQEGIQDGNEAQEGEEDRGDGKYEPKSELKVFTHVGKCGNGN
jgi:hypothetical protein